MKFAWSKQSRLLGEDGNWITKPFLQPCATAIPLDQFTDAVCGFFAAIEQYGFEPVVTADHVECAPANWPHSFQCQTGGSTQSPKRLRRGCDSWAKTFAINAKRFGTPQVYANCGHLSHSLTLYAVAEALTIGADFVHLPHRNAERALDMMVRHGVRVLYATPTQIRYLFGRSLGRNVPGLEFVMIGGGTLDGRTRDAIRDAAPNAKIHEFYGAAETSFITLTDQTTPIGSVGRAWPDVEIEVRRQNLDEVNGEIWVKSAYGFQDYTLGQSPDTRRDGDWITVGEMGRLDKVGNLYLAGRKSRMFTIADQNVFPEDIENVFKTVSGVLDCVILPMQDALRGNRAILFVASDRGDITKALAETAKAQLGPLLRPQEVYVMTVNEWPVLASGKPDIRKLGDRI